MATAQLDAARIAKAAQLALKTLATEKEPNEVHQRKTLMIERIAALAGAAAETELSKVITLTSEEFWLLSKTWENE